MNDAADHSPYQQGPDAALPVLEVLKLLKEEPQAFIYLHDTRGRFYYVSPGILGITGYRPEEWETHYSTYLTDNRLNEKVHELTRLALETGEKQPPYQAEIRSSDGRPLLLEINETPFRQDGKVVGIVGIARDISDHRRLLNLQEEFRSFLDTCPIPVVIYDTGGFVQYLNPAFESLFGWTLTELSGRKVPFIPDEEETRTMEGIQKVLAGIVVDNFETKRLTRSGKLLDISLTSFRLKNENGNPGGIVVMLRDETERSALEKEVVRRLAFEKSLVQNSMDGIIAVDRQGQVILFNQGAGNIMGYDPEEVIGRIHVTELYPPGQAREVMKALHGPDYGGPGKLADFQTSLLTKKGDIVPMRLSGSILYEGEQEFGSVGFFHDLTSQKLMENALKREKAITEELVDGSPIPTFVLDRDHRVVFWNRACVELTGVSRREMVGSLDVWRPFYPQERPVLANLILSQNLAHLSQLYGEKKLRAYPLLKGAFEAEDFFESLGGRQRHLHFMSAPIFDQEGELWGAIESIQDLSEHKALETRLSELATMDGLTGVFNRQYLEKKLVEEITKARRYRDHLGMILLDIDQFKEINDRYGHLVGDQVLKKTADIIKSCLRTTDIVARFGGDEFVVILPRTDEAQLASVRERLEVMLKNLTIPDQEGQLRTFTVSLGDHTDDRNYDQILRKADAGMYRRKQGR